MMSGGEVQLRCWFRGDLLDHAALRLNVPEVSMISDIATNKKKATSTAEMIRSYASALGVADASEKPSSDEQRKSEGKLVALKRALERFRDDLLSSRGTKKGKEAGIIGRQREKAWHRAARESLGWKEGEAEAALQVARVFSDGTPTMMSLSLVFFAQLYVPRTSASSSSSGAFGAASSGFGSSFPSTPAPSSSSAFGASTPFTPITPAENNTFGG